MARQARRLDCWRLDINPWSKCIQVAVHAQPVHAYNECIYVQNLCKKTCAKPVQSLCIIRSAHAHSECVRFVVQVVRQAAGWTRRKVCSCRSRMLKLYTTFCAFSVRAHKECLLFDFVHSVQVVRQAGRLDEAQSLAQEVLALLQGQLGSEHPRVAAQLMMLGQLAAQQGKQAAAEQTYRKALQVCAAGGWWRVMLSPLSCVLARWRDCGPQRMHA